MKKFLEENRKKICDFDLCNDFSARTHNMNHKRKKRTNRTQQNENFCSLKIVKKIKRLALTLILTYKLYVFPEQKINNLRY